MGALLVISLRLALLTSVVGLGACGDSRGVVGTWTVDVEKTLGVALEIAQAQMQTSLAQAPPEQRELMRSLMPAGDGLRQMLLEQLGPVEGVIELRRDGTCSMSRQFSRGPSVSAASGDVPEPGEGTWTQSGETITLTPRTKNGQPTDPEDHGPLTFRFKDGRLSLKPAQDAPTTYFQRK